MPQYGGGGGGGASSVLVNYLQYHCMDICIMVVVFHFESRGKSLGVCLERYVVSTDCGECLSLLGRWVGFHFESRAKS